MRYSELIFTNKPANNRKAKIEKLEHNSIKSKNKDIINKEKKDYVQDVIGVPEFDQAISHLSQYTMDKGTQRDKTSIENLTKKIKTGSFSYDDVGKLSSICDNNFKYLFSSEPDKQRIDVTLFGGAILAVCAIALRISYEFESNPTLMFFLVLINLVGISYTVINWPADTVEIVEEWLKSNNFPPSFRDKITAQVTKKMFKYIALFGVLILLGMFISWRFNCYALGNDVISIISLAISILSQRLTALLARHFEWKIYHNNV